MDPISSKTALATAGAAGGEGLYVDDVFSTYLYEGNGSTQTITNGIDLSGEGGMVWTKPRDDNATHALWDTERGATKWLRSQTSDSETTNSGLTSFNSDGFTLGSYAIPNQNTIDYASWTFRKAPGFFDVVTYTGDGLNGRTVSHNLGSIPGMIIIKNLSSNSDWAVYHRSTGNNGFLRLNLTNGVSSPDEMWNYTSPTSEVFTVQGSSNNLRVNASGDSYVAYIFAHDDQSFGTGGNESIIKCGGFTVSANSTITETLGWEPQWILLKRTSVASNWWLFDNMRGMTDNSFSWLFPNLSGAEELKAYQGVYPTSTGFAFNNINNGQWSAGGDFIYMAIRRPHKPPEAGTDVFAAQASRAASNGTSSQLHFTSNFPVDLLFQLCRAGDSANAITVDRMRGNQYLQTNNNVAEQATTWKFDSMDGVYFTSSTSATSDFGANMFRRAPGFFDLVSYTGTGSVRTVNHNLAATPELMIVKSRDVADYWTVYHKDVGATKYMKLNEDNSSTVSNHAWNDTAPTSSVFTVSSGSTNSSGNDYIAYLFATLPGISKVGTYSGTGSNIDVDCGFTAGARFVLIKVTNSVGDWYLWDAARGIVSGNDPYLLLNSTAAEVTSTDYIDPLNSGFTVTSSAPTALNASGGYVYLFLAIA